MSSASPSPFPSPAIELSIVVPTYNESGNIAALAGKISAALTDTAFEIIFVDDDSADGTAAVAKALAQADARVRCIRRVGRRGLSGACLEGMLSSSAPIIAVMDADLQHDETILPRMLTAVKNGAGVAIGSRYAGGGESGGGFSRTREQGSLAATRLSKMLLGIDVADPLSGFFMLRRDMVDKLAPKLAKEGFKILLDILALAPQPVKIVEIPYRFRERNAGESKLDAMVVLDFLGLVLMRFTGGLLPLRFVLFSLVGLGGVGVHVAMLWLLNNHFNVPFGLAQTGAAVTAMTSNFIINNNLTYRDQRLTGGRFYVGLLTFYAVCSFGLIANVSVAVQMAGQGANSILSGIAGALMSSVFNYAVSRSLTWRAK